VRWISTGRGCCFDGGGGGGCSTVASVEPKSVVHLWRHRTSERIPASGWGVPPLVHGTSDAVPAHLHATAVGVIGVYDVRKRKSAAGAPSVIRTADVVTFIDPTTSATVAVAPAVATVFGRPWYVERLSADDGCESRCR